MLGHRRRDIALATLVVLILAGCTIAGQQTITSGAGPYTQGSDAAATEARTVAPFHELEANSAVRVTARVGAPGGHTMVEVRTDDNLLPMVKTTVADGRLTVFIDGSITTKIGIDVTISTPELDTIVANASAVVRAEGVDTDSLLVASTAAADVSATGTVERLDLHVLAGAKAGLYGLDADEVTVELDGAGRAEVHATEAVRGTVTAGSVLWIDGDPDDLSVTTTAAGEVKQR
jgi:hypothetical protein